MILAILIFLFIILAFITLILFWAYDTNILLKRINNGESSEQDPLPDFDTQRLGVSADFDPAILKDLDPGRIWRKEF